MHTKKNIFSLLLVFSFSAFQVQSQTIRGTVMDADTRITLPGATVVIADTDPLIGTVTDIDGNFKFQDIAPGRYEIQVSFIGYEPAVISGVIAGSAREVVLSVGLRESVQQMETVEIRARQEKEKALNSMAMVSARQVSVEEARRYAGGVDDLAQLATAFAGVAGSMGSNGIAVRGNAPKGLLWRMEGVQIANPSHYANVTSFGGGAFTALSAQLLANSDFYTGAWPAEFGNALSGVYDVNLRSGNNEHYEHALQLGTIGLDVASEGPFKKGGRSSYLFNYRYSTFAFIAPVLPEDAAGNRFQDLSFKLSFPLKNSGILSLWGIGARDISEIEPDEDVESRKYDQDFQQLFNRQYMGAVGLNYKKTLGKTAYVSATASASGNGLKWDLKQLDEAQVLAQKEKVHYNQLRLSVSAFINKKWSSIYTNRTGIIATDLLYDVDIRNADTLGMPMRQISLANDQSMQLQFFSQSRISLGGQFTLNAGFHSQYLALNNALTFEPRIGINWSLSGNQMLSLAYGNHSMLEMLPIYLVSRKINGSIVYPNKDLGFSRAHHFIMAYSLSLNENLRLGLEPFYQHLYHIPVIDGTSFSLINLEQDWFIDDVMTDKGTGDNYGLDITLERFIHRNVYYMITASLFNSTYTGGDDIERDARYNKGYVINILGGKEWTVGKNNRNMLGANGRLVLQGGDRISPVDNDASFAAKQVIYDETRAFSNSEPNVFHLHLGMVYRKNKAKHASIWSVQLVNIIGSEEFYGYKYNLITDEVEEDKEYILLPQISYKIEF